MHTSRMAQRLAAPADDFKRITADAVRVVRQSAPALSSSECQLLSDLSRGRYLDGAFRFVEIMRRCGNPLHAAWWAEQLRVYALSGHPGLTLMLPDAFRWEENANHEGNEAQWDWWIARSPSARDRLFHTMLAQELASRAVRDALCRERPRSLRLS